MQILMPPLTLSSQSMEGSRTSISVSAYSADVHKQILRYDNLNSHLISADIALQTIRQADNEAMMHHI